MDTGGGKGIQAVPPICTVSEQASDDHGPTLSLAIRFKLWRNRQIASRRFRDVVGRLPLLRIIANRKANQIFRLTTGFVHTQILSACVHHGLFEAMQGRALSSNSIARRCGLATEAMKHLLEQARRLDLVADAGADLWILSDAGAVLAADLGLREMIRHHDMLYRDLRDPAAFWRGNPGDTELRRYWAYVRGSDPAKIGNEEAEPYSALMRESQAMLADCILASHDFGTYRSILDVGGGEGAFLGAVGARYPAMRLALFDLPAVTRLATRHLQEKGMLTRSTLHSGDFTVDEIPAGHDCVTLVRILCDHDDERVLKILSNLHRHLAPGTRLVVAEAMAGTTEGANLAAIYFSTYFAAMGSGRCRTSREIIDLLARSGFAKAKAARTTNPLLAGLVVASR
jgi:demethylspheroidene O-methyltransferase